MCVGFCIHALVYIAKQHLDNNKKKSIQVDNMNGPETISSYDGHVHIKFNTIEGSQTDFDTYQCKYSSCCNIQQCHNLLTRDELMLNFPITFLLSSEIANRQTYFYICVLDNSKHVCN